MSRSKDEIEEAESNWHSLALAKDYRCECCSQIIPYDEREIYFATKRCAACQPKSDDRD